MIKKKEEFNTTEKNEDLNDKNQKIEQQKQNKKRKGIKIFSDISEKQGQKEKNKFDKSIVDEDSFDKIKKKLIINLPKNLTFLLMLKNLQK